MKTEIPDVVIALLQKNYDADLIAHTTKINILPSTDLTVSQSEEQVEGGFID